MRIIFPSLLLLATPVVTAQDAAPGVVTTHLSGPVYLLKGRGGAMAASVGEDGVVLVDDDIPPMGPAVLEALGSITDQAPSFVINTHWHGDHTGGNPVLSGAGAVIVAHDNVRQRMSTEQFTEFSQSTTPASPKEALPVVTFNQDVKLHLNGETIAVYHVPHAHTDGDSIVHFTGSKVLHMGDTFWNGVYPRIDTDTGANVLGMMGAIRTGQGLCTEDTIVIAGHGDASDCAGLQAFLDMLVVTSERVKALMAEGKTLEQIQALKPNADYDESWGQWYIKPDDYLMFLYQSFERFSH